MGKLIVLSPEVLQSYISAKNFDAFQGSEQDVFVKTGTQISYQDLIFHPVHPDLVAARVQLTVEFFDAGQAKRVPSLSTINLSAFRLDRIAFLAGGLGKATEQLILLFTSSSPHDRCIYALDLATKSVVGQFNGHRDQVCALVAHPSPQKRLFLSSSYDGHVILWSAESMSALASFDVPEADSIPLAFDAAGVIFLVAFRNLISFFSVENPKEPFQSVELGHAAPVQALCVSPFNGGAMTAVRCADGALFLLDTLKTFRVICALEPPTADAARAEPDALAEDAPPQMCFSPDGRFLLQAACAGAAAPVFWDLREFTDAEAAPAVPEVATVRGQALPLGQEWYAPSKCCGFVPGTAVLVVGGASLGFFVPRLESLPARK